MTLIDLIEKLNDMLVINGNSEVYSHGLSVKDVYVRPDGAVTIVTKDVT